MLFNVSMSRFGTITESSVLKVIISLFLGIFSDGWLGIAFITE